VLLEMVELYRDRLKLDVMVVEAYNRILTLQPNNVEVMDALAAQYEVIPRWPELIAVLRKKAAIVASAQEKIALHLKWQTCTWRSSRTRPRPSRRSKRSSRLIGNVEALAFLKQMYEKRRDWIDWWPCCGRKSRA